MRPDQALEDGDLVAQDEDLSILARSDRAASKASRPNTRSIARSVLYWS
jgi:hypothetical protein